MLASKIQSCIILTRIFDTLQEDTPQPSLKKENY